MTTRQTADWDNIWLKYHDINEKKVQNFCRIFSFHRLPTSTKILDVGAGSGETLKMLKQLHFTQLKGIEPETRLFEHNNPDGMIMPGNCLDMSNIKEQYDVVLMFGVLHHLHTFAEMQRCLQNIKRTLVLNGTLYSVEQWQNIVRRVVMKLVRDTPIGKLHPMLRIERELLKLERNELDYWLQVEPRVTTYAQEIGLQVVFYKKDLRYRYIIFKKVQE